MEDIVVGILIPMSVVCWHRCDCEESRERYSAREMTLEDYALATDLLPALIFISVAGFSGSLPTSHSSTATKVSLGDKQLLFVSIEKQ